MTRDMEAAVGVFHHLKANLLGEGGGGEAEAGEEFPSEYSEDYNSTASRHFSGKVGSSSADNAEFLNAWRRESFFLLKVTNAFSIKNPLGHCAL